MSEHLINNVLGEGFRNSPPLNKHSTQSPEHSFPSHRTFLGNFPVSGPCMRDPSRPPYPHWSGTWLSSSTLDRSWAQSW